MPWLPIYGNKNDLGQILNWLNSEESVAFLISEGPGRWRAVHKTEMWPGKKVALWHIESGPLPLLGKDAEDEVQLVDNPFEAWSELRAGADSSVPYFGAGHPGVIWFNNRSKQDAVGMSSFEWIGSHYSIIGVVPSASTKKWWNRLARWIKKDAVRVPRSGPIESGEPEIWTLPNALREIKLGMPRDRNP